MRDSFVASVYGDLVPIRVEAPFSLLLDNLLVRGRVDAVYRRDGRVELVDLKTGSEPVEGDPGASVQLELYALAAVRAWGVAPDEVRTTYCYLREDGVVLHSVDWDTAKYEKVAAHVDMLRERLGATRYETHPGAWCARCEFANVCPSAMKARS